MRYVRLVSPTRGHLRHVADFMRREDVREVYAARGISPFDALYEGFVSSDFCFAGLDSSGIPVGIFGVCRENVRWWSPWLLGTEGLLTLWRPFLRTSRALLPWLLCRYARLRNYVDARNELSIRWLRGLGFVMEPAAAYGFEGRDFILFHKEREV